MFNRGSLCFYQSSRQLPLLGRGGLKAAHAKHAHQKSLRPGGAAITQHRRRKCIRTVCLSPFVPCMSYDYLCMGLSAMEAVSRLHPRRAVCRLLEAVSAGGLSLGHLLPHHGALPISNHGSGQAVGQRGDTTASTPKAYPGVKRRLFNVIVSCMFCARFSGQARAVPSSRPCVRAACSELRGSRGRSLLPRRGASLPGAAARLGSPLARGSTARRWRFFPLLPQFVPLAV